ncbi:uncharacterized protein LOC132309168 [Cornus florida]|uniref:uncharacterized protein LOC132309168 n=1 Tax=Cornus florida TaxID=4283 RepID=UPI00289F07F1|nr:uncharacterized protein LOC132309168 [Cornus florida]
MDGENEAFGFDLGLNYWVLGIIRRKRDAPPADYILKIKSFPLLCDILSSADVQNYQSGAFEVGGYKWKLSIYPNGDLQRKGNGYISLYLALEDGDLLPPGLEISIEFKLFLYNHIEDKYLIVQDGGERVCRFHKLKTEHGFSQFIPITTFNNASNGYLVNGSCAFGAEVCVLKNKTKGECLASVLVPDIRGSNFIWRLAYSKLDSRIHYSKYFNVAGRSCSYKYSISTIINLRQIEHSWSLSSYVAQFTLDSREHSLVEVQRTLCSNSTSSDARALAG